MLMSHLTHSTLPDISFWWDEEAVLVNRKIPKARFDPLTLQVCELHVAGYKFAILDNAFLVHKGFKTPDTFHLTKDMEQERNRLLFRQFKEQLKTKYPESQRRCY